MSESEMFERSFLRPRNYFLLCPQHQYEIDKDLGILDWAGEMTEEERVRFRAHYQVVNE